LLQNRFPKIRVQSFQADQHEYTEFMVRSNNEFVF